MNLTRESALWWVGVASAVIAGLSTLDPAAAAALGLPAAVLPYLRLYSLVAGIGSAWAKTSPFPSKNDPPAGSVSVSSLTKPAAMLFVIVALGASAACATKTAPALSPDGQAAVTATQVIKALDVIRDTVVALNQQTPPVISTAEMLKVVNFHESAVKTILAVPSGWKATVAAALAQLQRDLPADTWNRLLPYVTLYNSLVVGVA